MVGTTGGVLIRLKSNENLSLRKRVQFTGRWPRCLVVAASKYTASTASSGWATFEAKWSVECGSEWVMWCLSAWESSKIKNATYFSSTHRRKFANSKLKRKSQRTSRSMRTTTIFSSQRRAETTIRTTPATMMTMMMIRMQTATTMSRRCPRNWTIRLSTTSDGLLC